MKFVERRRSVGGTSTGTGRIVTHAVCLAKLHNFWLLSMILISPFHHSLFYVRSYTILFRKSHRQRIQTPEQSETRRKTWVRNRYLVVKNQPLQNQYKIHERQSMILMCESRLSSLNVNNTDIKIERTMSQASDTAFKEVGSQVKLSSERFMMAADLILQQNQKMQRRLTQQNHHSIDESTMDGIDSNLFSGNNFGSPHGSIGQQKQSTRRMIFAAALLGVGTSLMNVGDDDSNARAATDVIKRTGTDDSKLIWQVTPVNKRTGVTVFDAEQSGYTVSFVTYLSRFLLCFDRNCQKWWFNRAADIPRTATSEQVGMARLRQFAAFSASVEVGLQEYTGPDGPALFLQALLKRYCPSIDELQRSRELAGETPLTGTELIKKKREIKEARRQIALLFALMDKNQPTKELKKLLAAIDNGSITRVEVVQRGSGYAPGYGAPEVRFPKPDAGDEYERATGRAILTPNGKILRIDVINRGNGYSKPPEVTISSPATIRFQDRDTLSEFSIAKDAAAKAQAFLFRSGPNKGRIERIQLLDPGNNYNANEIIRVQISPPELSRQDGGEQATATAVLEYEVSAIQIINNGTGYAADAPIELYIEPPPVTARVNMNDPLIVARLGGPPGSALNEWLPAMDPRLTKQKQSQTEAFFNKIAFAAGSGGQSGCIGRECYDSPVTALAYPRAANNKGIFDPFGDDDDDTVRASSNIKFISLKRAGKKQEPLEQQFVSGSSSSGDVPTALLNVGDSSSQFLSLLPAGIGLQYNATTKQYELAVDPYYKDDRPRWMSTSTTPVDPDFGPRGREPIMRDMDLGLAAYLRFVLSGAICCSGVHLAVTPIDVVKTKVQADPVKYPGIIKSFRRVLQEEGIEGLAQGWLPTFIGFFAWGGVSYALTEYLRRVWTASLGNAAGNLEVPIILAAAGTAAAFGSFILCPFESLRIRLVSQKGYAPNAFGVLVRMTNEEGIITFFRAVPLFFAKEIPFAMAKFTVFDLTTKYLYDVLPAATEDIQLSLLVSLFGGILGGVCAAVVSNPADVTITTLKKSKTDIGIIGAYEAVIAQGGLTELFRGLPLRMIFYALVVSLQFLIYDSVRFLLGVGSDDLKLYLDVLGGALSENDGPL